MKKGLDYLNFIQHYYPKDKSYTADFDGYTKTHEYRKLKEVVSKFHSSHVKSIIQKVKKLNSVFGCPFIDNCQAI